MRGQISGMRGHGGECNERMDGQMNECIIEESNVRTRKSSVGLSNFPFLESLLC